MRHGGILVGMLVGEHDEHELDCSAPLMLYFTGSMSKVLSALLDYISLSVVVMMGLITNHN